MTVCIIVKTIMQVTILWAEVSGYMAACWRALAHRPGLDIHVLHPAKLFGKTNPFHQDSSLLQGISSEQFDSESADVDRLVFQAVANRRPQVLVVCGWFFRPYTRLVHAPQFQRVPLVMGMDTPWRGDWRQRLARFFLSGFLKRVDLVVTAGERSAAYARHLGVPENHLRAGFYGFDWPQFSAVAGNRQTASNAWPRQFLFVGRYVPQKDLPTLMQAYSAYRQSVSQPWGLTCCGAGEAAGCLTGVPGVMDTGFTLPRALPEVFGQHGVFVLPSKFEPWGVVVAEAAASGLPVICTTACGAGTDIVRPYYNGIVVASGDVAGLARAMRWMHEHESELPLMGRRGQALAEAYSAEAWAARWHNYFLELVESSAFRPQQA